MHVAFAAGDVPPFLTDVCALLGVAAGVAYVCHRLGIVPIVGFLAAGVLIGPNALGLVRNQSVVEAAAELGVLLLLFTIGIEFRLERLARMMRLVLVGGGLQVVLVTAAVALACRAFGVGWRASVFSGFLAALSSTAIVLKLLGLRGETQSRSGQAALGVLIFQDLAVVLMVLLVPMLAGESGTPLGVAWTLGKAAGIVALVLVSARRILPRVLEAVARTCSPDLFLLSVIAICIGTAWLVGMAGVSIALGAFLAGIVVSESPHAEHALAEILPLQIVFSATFFVSIGLLLDLGTTLAHLPLVLGFAAAVVALKTAATAVALRVAGETLPVACATGLLVAQVGEFSFVLERAGRGLGLTPLGMGEAGSQAFIAATVILMALTPLLAGASRRLGRRLERAERARLAALEPDVSDDAARELADHVVVAGYGRAAGALARVLKGSRVPFVVATLSPDGARAAESQGIRVLRGDYGKRHIQQLLGVERAKLIVVPDDDPPTAHRVVAVARALAPTARIVVRTRTRADAAALEAAGADHAVAAELEAVVGLFDDVLRSYRIDPDQILDHEATLRRAHFELFEPSNAVSVPCELSGECFATRTLRIRAGMPLAGRAIDAAGLRESGIGVRRVEVDGRRFEDPGGDVVLAVGAEVTFTGTWEAFREASHHFRASDGGPRARAPALEHGAGRIQQTAPWIDTSRPVRFTPRPGPACKHVPGVLRVAPWTQGCTECLAAGQRWVHLRLCLSCGHVGCCDSSPGRHASAHHRETAHPVVRSLERGETWAWCYVDELTIEGT